MADITPGYPFASGEKNVTHTKLNSACAGTINTTFHTGKSSIASNPDKSTTEVMVYDAAALLFKKATLGAAIFDHTALLSARTAKTAPITADAVLLSDSAAGGAYKQTTVGNLLFGGAAFTAPVAADKLPIYNSAGSVIGVITLANLITGAVAHTAPVAADEIAVREAGGAYRKMTLFKLINGAVAETVPTAAHEISIADGSAYKKIPLSVLISGLGASLSSPAGTELLQVLDGSTLKKLLLSDLRTYANNTPYLVYSEQQSSGTAGGTFTSGAWQTRTLNTEDVDTASIGSLSANQITLPAGTYRCRIRAPGYACVSHQARLYNVTDAAAVLIGSNEYLNVQAASNSIVTGRFTIAGAKAFRVEHRCSTTSATNGFGVATSWGTEVYTVAEFWKEA